MEAAPRRRRQRGHSNTITLATARSSRNGRYHTEGGSHQPVPILKPVQPAAFSTTLALRDEGCCCCCCFVFTCPGSWPGVLEQKEHCQLN
eukprot:539584-Rhodomonas_salina.4